jgi:alpha-1,6-mannosyltransferase
MMTRRILVAFSIVVFLVSIFLVNWQVDRTNFSFIALFYTLAFAAYLLLIRYKEALSFKHFILIAGAAHLISMIYEPYLSIDYYRFIWDGEITWVGINPFDFTPQELFHQPFVQESPYLLEVYEGIGGMSQANYSVYPPVNQGYFLLATAFSNSLSVNTFILKLLIVITEIFGAIYLRKLLMYLKIETSRMWLLYLNPLWIIECTGNTHFEGVMISYLFIALYFLIQKKIVTGAVFFAIAVQIKLIPLMLLPFFYRFLGFWKSALFYLITITIVILLALLQLNNENIENFGNSVRLYFQVFEFNSFILHYYIQYGIAETGWNLTKTYGPQLSRIAIGLIMTLALYGQINDWKKLFKRMTIAFFIYLLFSSTLHPWYVLTMLALSLFTNYTFPLLWSFLIFFSYVFYNYNDSSAFEVRTIVNIEYIVLIGLFIYEMIKRKSPFTFLRLN